MILRIGQRHTEKLEKQYGSAVSAIGYVKATLDDLKKTYADNAAAIDKAIEEAKKEDEEAKAEKDVKKKGGKERGGGLMAKLVEGQAATNKELDRLTNTITKLAKALVIHLLTDHHRRTPPHCVRESADCAAKSISIVPSHSLALTQCSPLNRSFTAPVYCLSSVVTVGTLRCAPSQGTSHVHSSDYTLHCTSLHLCAWCALRVARTVWQAPSGNEEKDHGKGDGAEENDGEGDDGEAKRGEVNKAANPLALPGVAPLLGAVRKRVVAAHPSTRHAPKQWLCATA